MIIRRSDGRRDMIMEYCYWAVDRDKALPVKLTSLGLAVLFYLIGYFLIFTGGAVALRVLGSIMIGSLGANIIDFALWRLMHREPDDRG